MIWVSSYRSHRPSGAAQIFNVTPPSWPGAITFGIESLFSQGVWSGPIASNREWIFLLRPAATGITGTTNYTGQAPSTTAVHTPQSPALVGDTLFIQETVFDANTGQRYVSTSAGIVISPQIVNTIQPSWNGGISLGVQNLFNPGAWNGNIAPNREWIFLLKPVATGITGTTNYTGLPPSTTAAHTPQSPAVTGDTLYIKETVFDAADATPHTITGPGAIIGQSFAVPTVTRVGNITTVSGGGARDQGWGHHQTYHVVTSNQDEYACYPTGTSQGGPGSSRPFVIAKMAAGTGTWTTVGSVTTESELNIFRHPPSDTVHGVFWPPNSGPAISDHPTWGQALITSGQWTYQDQAYRAGGMALDGTYCIVTQFDTNLSNTTAAMNRLWQTGTYTVGGGWVWNAKQTLSMGERRVYDFIFPAAYGVTTSFVDIGLRDVTLQVAQLPGSGFAWDGTYEFKIPYTTTVGETESVVYPIRTQPNSGLAPAFTFFMDGIEDSQGRLWFIHYLTDPNNQGPEGRFLTVKNGSTILYQQLLAYQSGEWSLYEDSQGRVWALVMAPGAGGANVRIYQMNTTTFALGTMTDLTAGFAGFNIDINTGLQTLASKRAGCSATTFLCGHYPASHSQMVGFRIDLPG